MSELTPCNYCTLQKIKERAKKDSKVVSLKSQPIEHFPKAQAVFVHPKKTHNELRFQAKYQVAWFVELSDHCVC